MQPTTYSAAPDDPRTEAALSNTLHAAGVPMHSPRGCTMLPGVPIGRDLLADQGLAEFGPCLVRSIGSALGRLHGVTPSTAKALSFLPVPMKEPARAEIARYRKQLDGVLDPRPLLEYALCWLDAHAPLPSHVALVHGSFHASNVLADERRMTAISGWENVHWGDPREDLGAFIARFARGGNDDKVAGGLAKFAFLLEGYNSTAPIAVAAPEVQYWEIFAAASAAVRAALQGHRCADSNCDDAGAALAGLRVPELEMDALLGIEAFERGKR